MKVQNILRAQMAIIGFGTALFFASAAPAQEITNTEWPERAGATEPIVAATNANSANSTTVVSAPATGQPVVAQATAVNTQSETKGDLALPLLMFGIGGVVLAVAETKRKVTNSTGVPTPSPLASL